jgi:hypothetical protein
MPAGKVRQLVQALAVALALYGCLRWAGFYEFASRDAEGLATLTQLLGDIYAVLLAFTIFVIWGQFTEVQNWYLLNDSGIVGSRTETGGRDETAAPEHG